MTLQPPSLFPFLGLSLTGDLGGVTTYTTRRGTIVWFDKAPPLEPPSPGQKVMRNRWRQAAAAWRALTDEEKISWERITCKVGLRITGYNFFVSLQVHPDPDAKRTVEFQAGENLP